MTGINIHNIECPYCSHKFYVHLPEESCTKEVTCVECRETIVTEYEYTEKEDEILVEVLVEKVEATND